MFAHRFLLIVPFFLVSGLLSLLGQTSIGTAGGDTSGPGGTVGFSVGQVAYINIDSPSGNINQGVQQPYDIIMVSNNEPEVGLKATIFPNPTITSIQLSLDEPDFSASTGVFTYTLYDPSGTMVQHNEITASTTMITLERLIGSVYFLHVSLNGSQVKTFKIFKTN